MPANPEHLPNVPVALAFNTAISFMTSPNWQAYSGEAVMSYGTQGRGWPCNCPESISAPGA